MKKFLALMMTLMMVLSIAGCTVAEEAKVMTYAEYDAAEMDAEVVIEAYVQATQSWWENKITV